MRKRGFTVVEVLMACFILSFIIILSISIMAMINKTLYDGQTENQNRSSLSDNIFFITREIQSAEKILLTEKSLKIKQLGVDGYNLEYTITDSEPFGSLNFKGKKMLDLDYDKSKFAIGDNSVRIELAVVKNNLDYKQVAKTISFNVAVRSEGVLIE